VIARAHGKSEAGALVLPETAWGIDRRINPAQTSTPRTLKLRIQQRRGSSLAHAAGSGYVIGGPGQSRPKGSKHFFVRSAPAGRSQFFTRKRP